MCMCVFECLACFQLTGTSSDCQDHCNKNVDLALIESKSCFDKEFCLIDMQID